MEKGPLIGEGFSAEVFAWGDAQVLKLFYPVIPKASILYEAQVSKAVHKLGLAVPAVGGIHTVKDRIGILYERLEGDSMLHTFSARPWLFFQLTQQFVTLQVEMHQCIGQTLPSQRTKMERDLSAAQLPALTKEKLLHALQQLPDGDKVCHGDYHPDNILLSSNGPVTIDWATATQGNPLADTARTALMLRSTLLPPGIRMTDKWLIQIGRRLLHRFYLQGYQKALSVSAEQINAWIPIQAALRLGENRPGEREWLLNLIQQWAAQSA